MELAANSARRKDVVLKVRARQLAGNRALSRGSQTITFVTRGLSRSYNQVAGVPSSKVTPRHHSEWLAELQAETTTFANSEILSQLGSFRHMTQSLHLPVLRLN